MGQKISQCRGVSKLKDFFGIFGFLGYQVSDTTIKCDHVVTALVSKCLILSIDNSTGEIIPIVTESEILGFYETTSTVWHSWCIKVMMRRMTLKMF